MKGQLALAILLQLAQYDFNGWHGNPAMALN